MATRSFGNHQSQSATNYINKKRINELFEAIMTALMVNKPDDHIAYIRECLDKVQNNPQRLRWDFFVTTSPGNAKGALLTRPTLVKNRQKILPPVGTSTTAARATPKSDSRTATSTKSSALPPIENHRKTTLNPPMVFILSSATSAKLCSKLLERYEQINYLHINDIANIDDQDQIDWKKYEHRFEILAREVEQRRSNARGFLLCGHLDEKNFGKYWLEKLERIDLMILLSTNRQAILNHNLNIICMDLNNDFDTILAKTIRAVDQIFPLKSFTNEPTQSTDIKSEHSNLPIIFCINIHQLLTEENPSNGSRPPQPLHQRSSLDEEFEQITNESEEEECNNSFISTLCQRLAEQFGYKHIHFGEPHKSLMSFEELKSVMIESMSTSSGFLIDHFPTSLDDLQKFQNEIGPCSVLIYIGERQTETKDDELNAVVEKFKEKNKAIYIDSRMEVDEIYEDLKKDILQHI